MTTCQICGRAIKAGNGNGLIAHHGYKRPGHGWQTASCFGTKFRPYEVACDALPLAIESVTRYIEQRSATLADLLANPPATLVYTRTDAWGKVTQETTYDRPYGFTAADSLQPTYIQGYKMQYRSRRGTIERDITSSKETKNYFEKRLKEWKGA